MNTPTLADIPIAPDLSPYMSHPEIVVGLAEGRFTAVSLLLRLKQMREADDGETE